MTFKRCRHRLRRVGPYRITVQPTASDFLQPDKSVPEDGIGSRPSSHTRLLSCLLYCFPHLLQRLLEIIGDDK